VKKACCQANAQLEFLSSEKAQVIEQACEETKVSLFLKPFKHGFKILRYFFHKT
jgi:aspartate ammonia-lyase